MAIETMVAKAGMPVTETTEAKADVFAWPRARVTSAAAKGFAADCPDNKRTDEVETGGGKATERLPLALPPSSRVSPGPEPTR